MTTLKEAEGHDYHNELRAERDALRADLHLFESKIISAIGGNDYLDPPDGGDVPLPEQVRRMRAERDRLRAALEKTVNALKPFSAVNALIPGVLRRSDFENCHDAIAAIQEILK